MTSEDVRDLYSNSCGQEDSWDMTSEEVTDL